MTTLPRPLRVCVLFFGGPAAMTRPAARGWPFGFDSTVRGAVPARCSAACNGGRLAPAIAGMFIASVGCAIFLRLFFTFSFRIRARCPVSVDLKVRLRQLLVRTFAWRICLLDCVVFPLNGVSWLPLHGTLCAPRWTFDIRSFSFSCTRDVCISGEGVCAVQRSGVNSNGS